MTQSRMWAWVSLFLAGCLAAPPAAEPGDDAPIDVAVRDVGGAPWPPDGTPRQPALVLRFRAPPPRVEGRLWLVRGAAHADLLDDLVDPPLRAATQRALVALDVEARASEVVARPRAPLEPGARYHLVWTRGREPPAITSLTTSPSPAAGARLSGSLPADRDVRVPPNTRALLVRFDGYVAGLSHALALHDDQGPVASRVHAFACEERGLLPGDCAILEPAAALRPERAYRLEIALLHDATGASIAPRTLSFTTRRAVDSAPPEWAPPACAPDEIALPCGCLLPERDGVRVRGVSDEPALVTLEAAGRRSATLTLGGAFELALPGLPAGEVAARLAALDLVGHTSSQAFRAETAYALAPLALDELRPDPLGPEPDQEFVELLNFGTEPIELMGFSLTDDPLEPGRTVVDRLAVEPGERVLVVSPTFDSDDASDGELPGGVRLAHLDGALSLRNDGAVVILRDPFGRRVDELPRRAPDAPGQCLGRLAGELVADPTGGCTPGAPTVEAP